VVANVTPPVAYSPVLTVPYTDEVVLAMLGRTREPQSIRGFDTNGAVSSMLS
jgi:hypothetical protein